MADQPVVHSTFAILRSYAKPPSRVFAAFSDPSKKRRWYAESKNHDLEAFEMEFRVGGVERAAYRFGEGSPFPGVALESVGSHLDIVPERRIVIASTMALGGHRISASLATFELRATAGGTDLLFTHQGAFFENADGPAMREAGWQQILGHLETELAA